MGANGQLLEKAPTPASVLEVLSQERLLDLSRTFAIHFYQGILITMQDDDAIIVCDMIDAQARAVLGLHQPLRVRGITDSHRRYLPWHREPVFNADLAVHP